MGCKLPGQAIGCVEQIWLPCKTSCNRFVLIRWALNSLMQFINHIFVARFVFDSNSIIRSQQHASDEWPECFAGCGWFGGERDHPDRHIGNTLPFSLQFFIAVVRLHSMGFFLGPPTLLARASCSYDEKKNVFQFADSRLMTGTVSCFFGINFARMAISVFFLFCLLQNMWLMTLRMISEHR